MSQKLAKMVVVGVAALVGCSRAEKPRPEPTPTPPAVAAAPVESPIDKVLNASSLSNAFIRASPYMEDKFDSIDSGTMMLAAWAFKSMRWQDVAVEKNETTFALVRKDVEEEKGKRLCIPGVLIQIETSKTDLGKFYDGLLLSDAQNLYKFLAVRSSGDLVAHQRARFCGVVTGLFDYSNSAGGTGHAVKVVGMFDLPQNKS